MSPDAVGRLRWRTLGVAALLYTACLALATLPVWPTFATRFPSCRADALQSLWVMRWYRDCLVHGRLPFFCSESQFPTGAHLGNWSPMHAQALLYVPLSFLTANDVLCYNLIWAANIVFTGVGTFVLVWYVHRSRACAFFGGLVAMLSGPMLLHALGHLELVSLGGFPLFLVAWMRWVDQPSVRRMLVAAGLYLLVAMSAGYFAVFATVPAILYAVSRDGLRHRLAGLAVFAGLTLPCLAVLFSPQILSRYHGYSVARSRTDFASFGSPAWALFVPSRFHHSGSLLPSDAYREAGFTDVEACSYLGLAVLGLIAYAAVARVGFANRRFWWLVFAILVILSLGGSWRLGRKFLTLPAGWLYELCPPFRQIRAPSRFNLPAVVCAAVLAAAGLRALLVRLRTRPTRVALVAGLCAVAILDLGVTPWRPVDPVMPPAPECYSFLHRHAAGGAMLEAPQFPSGLGNDLASACTYWQSHHGRRTSSGYSGYPNVRHDHLVYDPSPFTSIRLADPTAWSASHPQPSGDVVQDVSLADCAWLFLTVNRFDHLVVHETRPDLGITVHFHTDAIHEQFADACIYRDADASVYARDRLSEPRQPVMVCREGWGTRTEFWRERGEWRRRFHAVAHRHARLAVFNPSADAELCFTLDAMAMRQPRTVRLLVGEHELARWTVTPGEARTYTSPPFQLPRGLGELVLQSDGEAFPTSQERIGLGDEQPFSLRVAGVRLSEVQHAP